MGQIGGHAWPHPKGGGLPAGVPGRDRRGTPSTEAQLTRGSPALQASSGLAKSPWHRSKGAACSRQVRSLPRRLVQAVQAGAWRQVKRLSSRLVHACAGRALAVKRVTEHPGKKTPGVAGERWPTPATKAAAVARLGRWRGYRPAPLQRRSLPKQNGTPRPLAMPTLADQARPAVYRQARQPSAATTGDQHAYGFRPKRRCAEALDQGVTR
jgi:RNA-directed DNA polymerase